MGELSLNGIATHGQGNQVASQKGGLIFGVLIPVESTPTQYIIKFKNTGSLSVIIDDIMHVE